jgi:NADH dehydrogenase
MEGSRGNESAPAARAGTGRPRVVIVGGGMGGMSAAKALRKKNVDVLVVDRTNYQGFWPFLYQVATSQLEEETIAYPVRGVLRRHPNVNFQMGEVRSVDFARKRVVTDDEEIPYDYLILAAGSETNFFGNDELARHAYGLKDVEQADRLRNHILSVFEQAARENDPERRAALLTFIIVGGGPTGCELAGALAQLINAPLSKDFPTLDLRRESHVVLVQGADTLLPPFSEKLRDYAKARLEKLGVEVRLNQIVKSVDGGIVTFSDGSQTAATTVVWAAGVKAADVIGTLGAEIGSLGRVKVTETLNLPDNPEVFAIGDVMHLEGYKGANGGPYPMLAQVAIQGGRQAAQNVLASTEGKPLKPFKYFDKGMMAMIGRGSAIVDAFGVRMRGRFAFLGWLGLHIVYLRGFRNRALVLIDWSADYIRSNQGVRIITRPELAEHVQAVHERVLDHRRRTMTGIQALSPELIAQATEKAEQAASTD